VIGVNTSVYFFISATDGGDTNQQQDDMLKNFLSTLPDAFTPLLEKAVFFVENRRLHFLALLFSLWYNPE